MRDAASLFGVQSDSSKDEFGGIGARVAPGLMAVKHHEHRRETGTGDHRQD